MLQKIETLSNNEINNSVSIDKCELLRDEENVRVLLMIRMSGIPKDAKAYVDICCYGADGTKIAELNGVTYYDGGIFAELPSLMTVKAMVILRKVENADDIWESSDTFPNSIGLDDTVEFDSSTVAKQVDDTKIKTKMTRAERKAMHKRKAEEEEEIREFIKNDPAEKRKRITGRILTAVILVAVCVGGVYAYDYKTKADALYKKGMNLYNSGKFEEAVSELEKAEEYIFVGDKKSELDWCLAMSYARERNFFPAAVYYKSLNGYKESRANYRSIISAYSFVVAAGGGHTAVLKTDGSVVAIGNNDKGQCNVDEWSDIIRVAASGNHTLGLKKDNSVVFCGDNSKGQGEIDKWNNIITIDCGANHSVGVENIGRAVACGDNTYGQCEVEDWSGIVSVSAGREHTVGLKIDGTVVACGNNTDGACDVGTWTDIVQIAAGNGFTVGLKYNGDILYAGSKSLSVADVTKAKKTLSVSAGSNHILALSDDGRVKSYGGNDSNQGTTSLWTKVVGVSAGDGHSVAVTSDGTLLGVGNDDRGQISASSINGVGLPKSTVTIRKGE